MRSGTGPHETRTGYRIGIGMPTESALGFRLFVQHDGQGEFGNIRGYGVGGGRHPLRTGSSRSPTWSPGSTPDCGDVDGTLGPASTEPYWGWERRPRV